MNRFVPKFSRLVLITGVAVIHAVITHAADTGAVVGTVTGPTGAGLPGAVVIVRGEDPVSQSSAVTGENGEFRIAELEEGYYTVEGSLRGFFSNAVDKVEVNGRQTTSVHLSLSSATFRDTMEVSSQVTAASLEASELRESAATDLGEALERLPGVWKSRRGGIANDVVVRGYREDDITVLIDGARVMGACPNRMDPPAFHVDFSEVDRVELAPASGRMAVQGSLGGMVNVVTKKPEPGLHVDVPVVVGSDDLFNAAGTVSYGVEGFGILGGVSHRTASAYQDGSGERFTETVNYNQEGLDTDAYSVTSAWTRLFYQPAENHELSLSYSRQESDEVLYPTLMMDAVYDNTDRLVAGYRWEPKSGAFDQLRATAYGTRVDHWMTNSLRTSSAMAPRGWGMGTMASTEVFGASVEAIVGSFTFGAEAYERRWDAWTEMAMMSYARQFSIPDVTMLATGMYASWQHALSASTELEIGGRIDHVTTEADEFKANTDLYYAYHGVRDTSRSDTEPSASVQVTHRFNSSLSLSGGLSTATRSPDPRERYFALKRMGGDWVGDPEIDPPRSTRAELELEWEVGAATFTATAWADRVDSFITLYDQDRINNVPGVMNTRARSYANVDAFLRGFTLGGTAALSSRIYLAGNLSYLRGTKDADPERNIFSTNLGEMPPLSARLALRWQNQRFFAELEGVGMARQDDIDTDLNESSTPGYGIANIKTGVTFGRWRAQLVLENVFDRTYHEHFSYIRDPFRSGYIINEPGRRVALTLGWSL